jgi:hypothetical protein
MTFRFAALSSILLCLSGTVARADPPQIVGVTATHASMGWRFDVSIGHPDTGWDHYADGWEVLDATGKRLGYRELFHPHVDEQPFTRSLNNVMVPDGTTEVFIRASCNRDGWSEQTFRVPLRR